MEVISCSFLKWFSVSVNCKWSLNLLSCSIDCYWDTCKTELREQIRGYGISNSQLLVRCLCVCYLNPTSIRFHLYKMAINNTCHQLGYLILIHIYIEVPEVYYVKHKTFKSLLFFHGTFSIIDSENKHKSEILCAIQKTIYWITWAKSKIVEVRKVSRRPIMHGLRDKDAFSELINCSIFETGRHYAAQADHSSQPPSAGFTGVHSHIRLKFITPHKMGNH
jgi:hypothetical protein